MYLFVFVRSSRAVIAWLSAGSEPAIVRHPYHYGLFSQFLLGVS